YRWPKVLNSARNITNHLPQGFPGAQLAIHSHCVRLLGLFYKDSIQVSANVRPSSVNPITEMGRLLPVLRIMEERYGEHVTLTELAEPLHLHPVYFASFFKRVMGMPPLRYLARLRLERARTLVVGTDRPLGDVAKLTGFYDAAHLI